MEFILDDKNVGRWYLAGSNFTSGGKFMGIT